VTFLDREKIRRYGPSMLNLRGDTRADYFHFICKKCSEAVQVTLGTDGAVATITATCSRCGEQGELKLWQTR